MINHCRTLLINSADDRGSAEFFGEYVSPMFAPLSLPSWMTSVRKALFGANPDPSMLAWRTRQLLGLLHASPQLDAEVRSLDPRITYSLDRPFPAETETAPVWAPRFDSTYGVVELDADPFTGTPTAPDGVGGCVRRMEVSWADGSATVRDLRLNAARTYEMVDERVPLLDTGYTISLPGAGGKVEAAVFLRPQASLGDIEATLMDSRLLDPDRFFPGDAGEPYATYRRWWLESSEFPVRFGGIILGFIRRTEEIRLG